MLVGRLAWAQPGAHRKGRGRVWRHQLQAKKANSLLSCTEESVRMQRRQQQDGTNKCGRQQASCKPRGLLIVVDHGVGLDLRLVGGAAGAGWQLSQSRGAGASAGGPAGGPWQGPIGNHSPDHCSASSPVHVEGPRHFRGHTHNEGHLGGVDGAVAGGSQRLAVHSCRRRGGWQSARDGWM